LWAGVAVAQIGAGMPSAPTPVGRAGAPSGVAEKDELQGFHRAMALQATSEQTSEFRAVVTKTEAADRALDELAKSSDSTHAAAVRQAVDAAQADMGKFVGEFSPAQKAGLKDITAKLLRASSELDEQEKGLETRGGVEGARKALANFRAQQDSLAVEMGIVISEGAEEVAFTIPARKSTIGLGGQAVGITTSAVITRASGDGNYKVEATTDLAGLQENIGAILGALMNKEDRCGERIRVKEATITPETPTAVAMTRLHYERWVCSPGYGGTREMTEGNATVVMKLTAGVGENGQVRVAAEMLQVEAERFFADLLKSGALGAELREKTSAAVTAVVVNLKTELPAAGEAAARSARFASPREGELSVVVDGEMRMSDEQAKAFGEQLKQRAGASARKQ
jgi:hypothetical protein